MFDTNVVVVGNALTTPEWRRFERTNALVANFKVASTSRRFDKQNNRWIDGDNLRLRVNCWRRLAEGVVASIKVGDPVVVAGRLYTRDWTTEDGQRRTSYELEAVSVGHDLARGVGVFRRGRVNVNTTAVEDAEADKHVKGEPTEAAPEENARSEALTAGLDDADASRTGGERGGEFPPHGYDGPVNDDQVPVADLNTVIRGELNGDLDRVIALAQQTFGEATPIDLAGAAPDDVDGPAGAPPSDAAPVEGEPAATSGTGSPDPGRGRRSRSRVPANA